LYYKETVEGKKKAHNYRSFFLKAMLSKDSSNLDYLDKGLDKSLLLDNMKTQLRSYIYPFINHQNAPQMNNQKMRNFET